MCFVAVCWALAGKLCVLLLSVGWWLESHVFCYCLLAAGQPCVLLLSVGGWTAMCFVAVCWALAGKLCVLLLSVGRWLPFQKHAGTTACGDRNPGEGENFLGAVQEESKKAPVILHPTAMLQEVLAKSKKGNGMIY